MDITQLSECFCSSPHKIKVEMKLEHHFGGQSGKLQQH